MGKGKLRGKEGVGKGESPAKALPAVVAWGARALPAIIRGGKAAGKAIKHGRKTMPGKALDITNIGSKSKGLWRKGMKFGKDMLIGTGLIEAGRYMGKEGEKARQASAKTSSGKKAGSVNWLGLGDTAKKLSDEAIKRSKKTREKAIYGRAAKRGAAHGDDLNALIKQRQGLKKGTPEYAAVQNKINRAYNVKKRHGTTVTKDTKGRTRGVTVETPGIGSSEVKSRKTILGGKKTTVTKTSEGGRTRKTTTRKDRQGDVRRQKTVIKGGKTKSGGTMDKTIKLKYDRHGTKKRSKVKYDVDIDQDGIVDKKGTIKRKYDKQGNIKKTIKTEGGRRVKTDAQGNVISDRRTLGGFLRGEGKKSKSPATYVEDTTRRGVGKAIKEAGKEKAKKSSTVTSKLKGKGKARKAYTKSQTGRRGVKMGE